MFRFEHLKETITVFISNAISDHEMSFQIKHTIKRNFRLKLGNLKHIELQPNLPYGYIKKGMYLTKTVLKTNSNPTFNMKEVDLDGS